MYDEPGEPAPHHPTPSRTARREPATASAAARDGLPDGERNPGGGTAVPRGPKPLWPGHPGPLPPGGSHLPPHPGDGAAIRAPGGGGGAAGGGRGRPRGGAARAAAAPAPDRRPG